MPANSFMIKMVGDNYDDDDDIDDKNTWAMVRVAAWAIFLLGQRNAWHSNVSFLVITRSDDDGCDDGYDDDGDDDDRDDKYDDDGGDKDVAFQSLISGGCVLFINIITSIINFL